LLQEDYTKITGRLHKDRSWYSESESKRQATIDWQEKLTVLIASGKQIYYPIYHHFEQR